MPFKSKAQMKAAFAGALGEEMQGKAKQWAHETPNAKELSEHASNKKNTAKKKKKRKIVYEPKGG